MFGYEDELQHEIEILQEEIERLKWDNRILREELDYERRSKLRNSE